MGLQSGRIMAVKSIPVEEGQEKNLKEKAKQKVETIARLCHVSLSFSSALGYLLIVMDRHISLSLCIRKVGKWESRLDIYARCRRFFARLSKYENGQE